MLALSVPTAKQPPTRLALFRAHAPHPALAYPYLHVCKRAHALVSHTGVAQVDTGQTVSQAPPQLAQATIAERPVL